MMMLEQNLQRLMNWSQSVEGWNSEVSDWVWSLEVGCGHWRLGVVTGGWVWSLEIGCGHWRLGMVTGGWMWSLEVGCGHCERQK